MYNEFNYIHLSIASVLYIYIYIYIYIQEVCNEITEDTVYDSVVVDPNVRMNFKFGGRACRVQCA